MSFKLVENTKDLYVLDEMFQGNALFAIKVDGAEPKNQAVGALIIDHDQAEILRTALYHLEQANSELKEWHTPFNKALSNLSYVLGNVSIEKDG